LTIDLDSAGISAANVFALICSKGSGLDCLLVTGNETLRAYVIQPGGTLGQVVDLNIQATGFRLSHSCDDWLFITGSTTNDDNHQWVVKAIDLSSPMLVLDVPDLSLGADCKAVYRVTPLQGGSALVTCSTVGTHWGDLRYHERLVCGLSCKPGSGALGSEAFCAPLRESLDECHILRCRGKGKTFATCYRSGGQREVSVFQHDSSNGHVNLLFKFTLVVAEVSSDLDLISSGIVVHVQSRGVFLITPGERSGDDAFGDAVAIVAADCSLSVSKLAACKQDQPIRGLRVCETEQLTPVLVGMQDDRPLVLMLGAAC